MRPDAVRGAGGPASNLRAEALSALALGTGAFLMVSADVSVWRLVVLVGVLLACLAVVSLSAGARSGAAAVTMAVVGVVGVVVGCVVAFAWWPALGLSAESVGAGLCALGGLGLTVVAGARVGCVVHGWWRALAVLAALVVAYGFVLPLAIAAYATHAPTPSQPPRPPPSSLPTARDVTLVTADGVSMAGWYVPSTNHAAVVLRHGASSDRSAVVGHAQLLARHGYGVLMLDARGHGSSGGQVMRFGWYGDADIAAALDFLRRQSDVDPGRVGAVGLSMGGEEAIGAMAVDPRIRAVIAEGATNRVLADREWLADRFGLRGRLQLGVDWVLYTLTDLLTPATPPMSLGDAVAAAAPRPVLLIAGGTTEEPLADAAIQQRAPQSVRLWVVPRAGHIGGLGADPAGWEQRVVAFLDTTLTSKRR